MVTKQDCLTVRHFRYLQGTYSRSKELKQVRASGKCQTWKTRPDDFKLPVKYGMYESLYITPANAAMFITEDEYQSRKEQAQAVGQVLKNPAAFTMGIQDTEIHTWFERDRSHVELRNKRTQQTIAEWWDEDVQQAVEDGFLNARDWHGSAYQYAKERRMLGPKRKTGVGYQPKTGAACFCKPGIQRDNCPTCEGTGQRIDFAKIRNNPRPLSQAQMLAGARKNPSDTSHLTINRIGSPSDYAYATISRKNRYGEYVVRLYVDAKYQKNADYFTEDKQDAFVTAQDMVQRAGARKNPSDVLSGKSIQTEYFGPGNRRGARIKASVIDGNRIQASITVPFAHELDEYGRHIFAAEKMRDKMGWTGDLIGVGTRKGYVFGFKDFSTQARKNPGTLRATGKRARKMHSRTHYDTSGTKGKYLYVQKKDGVMWLSIAAVKDSAKGRVDAQRWAQRYHRHHPGSTLRLFV